MTKLHLMPTNGRDLSSKSFRTLIMFAIPALAITGFVAAGPSSKKYGLLARIGDIDGFGYGAAEGLRAANGRPANAHQNNVLGSGDFLPDLNQDRAIATGRGDDFDLRSEAELADTANTFGPSVVKTTGTSGSKFTDISLSTSYDQTARARRILTRKTNSKQFELGTGREFPHPPSNDLPIQPGFVFEFEVPKQDLAGQTPIFFNLIFGDYDVSPAHLQITRSDGTTKNLVVNSQSQAEDGLIQAATTNLDFNDVFQDGGKVWKASLKVDFLAPREPYTTFDYVELSTTALVDASQQSIEPLGNRRSQRPPPPKRP